MLFSLFVLSIVSFFNLRETLLSSTDSLSLACIGHKACMMTYISVIKIGPLSLVICVCSNVITLDFFFGLTDR